MAITGEHAEDVLARACAWIRDGADCALIVITETQGGAVRSPGALLAVSEDDSVGYISGGCIDADVRLQARNAMSDGKVRAVRYGAGSPFVDLPLPCGGAIEILIIPNPALADISAAQACLAERSKVVLSFSEDNGVSVFHADRPVRQGEFVFEYAPKLKLRIAGRGADALALATVADAAGYETHLQLIDEDDIAAAQTAGLSSIEQLTSVQAMTDISDDAWTAFVLLFHDQDWEVPLLQQALAGPAFYIGAVGSFRTHEKRVDALKRAGSELNDIDRIHGPIGVVPSLRDASMLALSTLAEIIDHFPGKARSKPTKTALLLLAAGASSRFGAGDKLLAKLGELSVLERSGSVLSFDDTIKKIAIVSAAQSERAQLLDRSGWQVIENPHAAEGQATSVRAGLRAIQSDPEIDQIVVLLADMPYVPEAHVQSMIRCASLPSVSAIMTDADGVLVPPALVKKSHFEALCEMSGDRGAKAYFLGLETGTLTMRLAADLAVDIDTVVDLNRLREAEYA